MFPRRYLHTRQVALRRPDYCVAYSADVPCDRVWSKDQNDKDQWDSRSTAHAFNCLTHQNAPPQLRLIQLTYIQIGMEHHPQSNIRHSLFLLGLEVWIRSVRQGHVCLMAVVIT